MNSNSGISILSKLLLAGFFVGIIFSAYNLYQLPAELVHQTGFSAGTTIDEIQPVFTKTQLIVGATFLCGLLTVVLQILEHQKNSNVVYTESFGEENDESNDQVTVEDLDEMNREARENELIDMDAALANTSADKPEELFREGLAVICNHLEVSQAAAFKVVEEGDVRSIKLFTGYAFHVPEGEEVSYRFGEGLSGQAAKEGKKVNIQSVPDGYVKIISGLGQATPQNLLIIPVRKDDNMWGVVELASFKSFTTRDERVAEDAFNKLAQKALIDNNVSLNEPTQ